MDLGKLKTVAIVILLLANVAFGGILISDRLSSADMRSQSRNELVQVMARLGVALEADIIPADAPLYRYTVERDHAGEALLAAALLGEVSGKNQGGNIYYYENENGWARFRSSGSFEIAVLRQEGGSIEERLSAGGLVTLREGGEYVCAFGGVPVFNCRFSLSSYSGGGLFVSGRRLPGAPTAAEEVESLSAAAVLLRFRDETRAYGGVYTRIEAISRGHILQASATAASLAPVWRIETDGGTYYMDAVEGALVSGLSL